MKGGVVHGRQFPRPGASWSQGKESVVAKKRDNEGVAGIIERTSSIWTGYALKISRATIIGTLDYLRRKHSMLWHKVAYLYLEAENRVKDAVDAGLRFMLLPIEIAIKASPALKIFQDLGIALMADAANEINNYFETMKVKPKYPDEYPEGFTPPGVDDVKHIFREVGDFMAKRISNSALARLASRFNLARVIDTLGLGQSDQIIGSILGLEDEDWKTLVKMWGRWTPQQKHEFIRLDKFFPTPETLIHFLKMTPRERQIFLEMTEANKLRLMSPGKEEEFRRWRRQVARYGRRVLRDINQGLGDANEWMVECNAEREAAIEEDRYTPENLERYPWRKREPECPEERREVPRPRGPWLGWVITVVFVGLVGISLAAGLFATGCQNEVPHVMIISPDDGVVVSTPSIRLIGQATDDRRVSRLTVRLNDQMPRNVFMASGSTVEWTTEVKGLKPEWNTIRVEVRDRQGRRGTTDIRVRYASSTVEEVR